MEQRVAEREPIEAAPASRADAASLAFCLLGNFLLRTAAAAAGTLISLYLASLQRSGLPIGAKQVMLVGMSFLLAELLASQAFGILSDVRGRKPFMVLGPVLGGVAVQLIFLAPTLPLVLLARVLQGLSTASSVPSTLSYLSAETGPSEKLQGRVMALFEAATILGLGAGFVTGGMLWDAFKHSAFLAVLGVYAGSVILLLLVRDRRAIAGSARTVGHHLGFLRSGAALRLIPAWVAVNAVVGLWLHHIDFQMGKADDPTQLLVGGFTGRQIGLYTGGFLLLFVVGVFLWGFTFGRLRATQVMTIGLVGLFALAGLAFLLNHARPGDVLRIVAILGLMGVSLLVMSGFTPAALVYLSRVAEEFPESRGSMMGLYSVFFGVGQIVGTFLGGFFASWRGVDGMIVLTAILGAISAACVAELVRHEYRAAPARASRPLRLPPGLG